jgi:anti-sigma factor RsiW
MTCAEAEDRLDDYVDGSLPEAEFQEMELHLSGCPACREQERRLRSVLAQAAALPRTLSPAHDLWPGIAERVAGRNASPLRGWRPIGLAAAAAVAIALASTLLPRPGPPAAPAPLAGLPVTVSPGSDTLHEVEADYARATTALLAALSERPSSLSSETLASVQKNLEVIDQALAEVRLALRKDPHNGELTHMLVATHRKKLEVLRRVVKLSTQL